MQRDSKIGVIVPHLGTCQEAHYAVRYINYLLQTTNKYDFVIFYEELVRPRVRPMCATMNISEIWSFDGTIISTNISNTITAVNSIAPVNKIFYMWDVEWLRRGNKNYVHNMQAYRSSEIKLIARSEAHAKAVEKYCNRKASTIIPNFNLIRIIEKFVS